MLIRSNGSRFGGEEPDTVAQLVDLLGREALDPSFEQFGNFVIDSADTLGPGMVRVWGNFASVSHVFEIDGTREELAEVITAIRANQARPSYAAARARFGLVRA